jgi:alginate O-acetyltransferase complex protein AlgI
MSSELLFTRPAFWVFMLVVMIALSLLKRKTAMRNAFLFAASLFFYWKTSASFVFLLLFSTAADWGIAMAMARSDTWKRTTWLILSVVINLGLLGFFKYAYFFADASATLFGTTWEAVIPGVNWMNSHLSTSFRVDTIFADYIAMNLVDRVFASPTSYSGMEVMLGLYGYSLQVFADFSGYSDIAIGVALLMGFRLEENFRSPYKARNLGEFWKRWHISLSTWLRDYLYIPMGGSRTASIFSGIFSFATVFFASMMLGESGEINFGVLFLGFGMILLLWSSGVMYPKWGQKLASYVNVMATMVIGGLWHGASWNFLLWGALNGLGLLVYKVIGTKMPWAAHHGWWARAIGLITTFNFITFTRIWFRSGSGIEWETTPGNHNFLTEWFTANDLLYQMSKHFNDIPWMNVAWGHFTCITIMALGFALHLSPERVRAKVIDKFTSLSIVTIWIVTAGVAVLLWKVGSALPTPFIYFQF